MKKYFIYLIALCNNLFSFGQDLSLEVSKSDRENNKYYLVTDLDWKVHYQTGHCAAFFEAMVDGENKISSSLGDHREYRYHLVGFVNEHPKKIRFRTVATDAGWIVKWFEKFRSCNSHTSTADKYSQYQNIELCKGKGEYMHDHKDKKNFSSGYEVEYWLNIRYKIIPLHTLAPEIFSHNIKNTYLPIGAKAKLFAKEGFPSELYHYQVATEKDPSRYPDGYNWKNLSADLKENGGEVLSVSAEDIFGSEDEARKNIGKTVYFRAVV